MRGTIARRAAAGASVLVLVAALGACDELLEVTNYGALDERNVSDTMFVPQMVNAAINEFQLNYDFLIFAGAILGDEGVNGHNFEQWQDIDLRIVEDDNSQLAVIYEALQGARGMGDEMVSRIRDLVEDPGSSVELATALAYTGMSYVYLAEYFCYAPIAADSPAVYSDAIMDAAMERFDEAIDIAGAAGGAEGGRIVNFARVGAARAALFNEEMAAAVAYATPVPADFEIWVRYVDSPTDLRNYLEGATTGTNRTLGVDVYFRDLGDNRVRHSATPGTGHNQKTLLWDPYQGESFDAWTAVGPDQPFLTNTGIRLASGLEARYILAEAGALSNAELEAFINERRVVGGQDPFPGGDLQAELRDQRRRDFFLDGHRLGDLRRYLANGIDMFPSGPHPNDAAWGWGNYETATCFIPHRDEQVGNPNYTPLPLQ